MTQQVLVHQFSLGDVEDPAIYAAEPLWQWQQTPAGQWVMQHAVEKPTWVTGFDAINYRNQIRIIAHLSDSDATFFYLKYGHNLFPSVA